MLFKRTVLLPVIAVCSTLCLSACDYNNLIADVREFDSLISTATNSLKKTYLGINDYYRKTYIIERRFDVSKGIWVRNDDRSYSALVYKIDPVEIRARELVLQGLAEYSAGLAAIAGSDAPEQASALAAQLSARITSTASTLSSLQKDSGGNSFDVSKFSGPISNIARITAKYWVRNMQKQQIKQSVEEGAPFVTATLDLLEADIENVFQSAYNENAELSLLAQQNYYNKTYRMLAFREIPDENVDARKKRLEEYESKVQALLKDKSRTDFLNEVSASAKELADLRTASPLPLVASMRAAHQTVLQYVDSDSESETFKDKVRGAAASVTGVLRNIHP